MAGTDLEKWRGFIAEAEDVLFFRDSRPSTLGADHYLQSIFPPLPATVYGMLRTCRLTSAGIDLDNLGESNWPELPLDVREEVGEWGRLGALRLRGPWLVRKRGHALQCLFPAPADLGLLMDDSETLTGLVRYLPTRDRIGGGWSHRLALLVPYERSATEWRPWKGDPKRVPQPGTGWYVTLEGLTQWLTGTLPDPSTLVKSDELWMTEQRTGVGILPHQRTAEDGKLYTFGFVRLQSNVSIGFELSGSSIETGVAAILGGEGRLVTLREGPSVSDALAALQFPEGARTLYLATPGVFPGEVASEPSTVSITAAAVRGMTHAGGWDLARKRPKPLRRAVPAGSVYHTDQSGVQSFMRISDGHEEGFGVVLAGTC